MTRVVRQPWFSASHRVMVLSSAPPAPLVPYIRHQPPDKTLYNYIVFPQCDSRRGLALRRSTSTAQLVTKKTSRDQRRTDEGKPHVTPGSYEEALCPPFLVEHCLGPALVVGFRRPLRFDGYPTRVAVRGLPQHPASLLLISSSRLVTKSWKYPFPRKEPGPGP